RQDLAGQRRRFLALVPGVVLGGAAGAALLTVTSEDLFRRIIPWLLFVACGLLAGQDRIRSAVARREERRRGAASREGPPASMLAVALAGVYGGYFGAALGIILIAVLGVTIDDEMRRINALKQVLALTANVSAAVLLVFSGKVRWEA